MTRSLLADAFAHHVWASLRVIDTCLELDEEQLQTAVPGTYGSILDTARHLVASDAGYLSLLSGGEVAEIDDDGQGLSLADLRVALERHGPVWEAVLARDPDPDTVATRHRDDGTKSHAPLGIRLAQVVHHGTDHRSQICTALTSLGIEPPEIDVWDYGGQVGLVHVTPAGS